MEQKQYAQALLILRPLADGGDAYAQSLLGWMYDVGSGVQQDEVQAANWYRKAAEQGLPEAEAALARLTKPITTQAAAGPSVMTVEEFLKAFTDNATAAEVAYKGKTVTVKGIVDWVGNSLLDKKPATNLKGSTETTAHTNCVFPESARAAVNALKEGQTVTVRAQLLGFMAGNLSLKNAELAN